MDPFRGECINYLYADHAAFCTERESSTDMEEEEIRKKRKNNKEDEEDGRRRRGALSIRP